MLCFGIGSVNSQGLAIRELVDSSAVHIFNTQSQK